MLTPLRAAAGFVCVAFATAFFRSAETDGRLIALAAVLGALILVGAASVPWRRLPSSALVALPVGCDLLIAVLRQSQGGSRSGYSPLLVLPAVWVAFVAGRRGVAVVVVSTGLTLLGPMVLVGGDSYPATAVRGAVLLTVVTAIVGLVTERGVAEARLRTEEAVRRAGTLDRLQRAQSAIAMSQPALDEVLATVVREALALTGADGAVVELSGGNRLAAGASPTDVRSSLEVPLVDAGEAAGVLTVLSARPHAFGEDEARVLALLAPVTGAVLARAELLETLAQHARTDSLTGLANRRSWDEQLERALAHAARSNETVSVAVCDVDRLKWVNDNEGHAAGDDLLRDVAACLGEGARAADLLARIGGDEFALLLPGADRDAAVDVLQRLTARLPAGRSVSLGIAEWDGREGADELVARADARMYEQKRRSRAVAAQ